MRGVSRIEVTFAVPVELTEEEQRSIVAVARRAARRSETPEIVHWPAGIGCKPIWNEPQEPTFDDSVFCVECFARERYESEPYRPAVTPQGGEHEDQQTAM